MYKIILSEKKLDEFIDFLPDLEIDEVYFCSLMGRHKYCGTVANRKDNQLARFVSSKDHLKEKIRRLECPNGSYQRNGLDVPQDALALYITLNPRNLVKANKNLLIELAKNCTEGNMGLNPVSLARTAVHRAIGRKIFVDFDFDGVEHVELQKKNILPESTYRVLKTRGGFHLLVYLDKVKEVKTNWYKDLSAFPGCDVRGSDTLVPVAGCTQGGFTPCLY